VKTNLSPDSPRLSGSGEATAWAYIDATVTGLLQYRRIRGSTTRLLPRLSVPGTGAFTQLFKRLGGCPSELTNMTITNVELLRLGRRIRTSRKLLGRKQKDFCERCGLDRSYFDGVERGKRNLTFSNLCQICDGLNCDIAALTEGIPHLKGCSEAEPNEE
jgi:DNA-binding Xre family transcriptional regulator